MQPTSGVFKSTASRAVAGGEPAREPRIAVGQASGRNVRSPLGQLPLSGSCWLVRLIQELHTPSAHREFPAQKQRFSAFVQVLRPWLPVVRGRV